MEGCVGLQQLTCPMLQREGMLLMMPMVLHAQSREMELSALQQSALGSAAPGTRYARHASSRFSCGTQPPGGCASAAGPRPPTTRRTRDTARSARGTVLGAIVRRRPTVVLSNAGVGSLSLCWLAVAVHVDALWYLY
jgi:hypothetical protein